MNQKLEELVSLAERVAPHSEDGHLLTALTEAVRDYDAVEDTVTTIIAMEMNRSRDFRAWMIEAREERDEADQAAYWLAVLLDREIASSREARRKALDAKIAGDTAYRGRAELIAVLARNYGRSSAEIVHGADPDAPGWPVLYIDADPGQLSWHINPADLDLFDGITQMQAYDQEAPVWDGHDDAEKSRRLLDIDFRYL